MNATKCILTVLVCTVLASGCSDVTNADSADEPGDAPKSLSMLRQQQILHTPSLDAPQGEELRLIHQVLDPFEGDERAALQLILFDSVPQALYTLADPELDRLVARIYELRQARATNRTDQAELRVAQSPAAWNRVPTRVVFVDHLPRTGASAVIRRTTTRVPRNEIVLTRGLADGATLVAAIAALQRIRDTQGVVPGAEAEFAVRGQSGRLRGRKGDVVRAQKWVERVLAKQPSALPEYGTVHTTVIPIGRGRR